MSISIALLRAVNVAGHNKVAMSELRDLLGRLGLTGAKSLLQSGNLIFESDRRTGLSLEKLLQAETKKQLGVAAEYFVRTASEWKEVIACNPFPDEAKRDPGHLVVMFLKDALHASNLQALHAAIKGRETIQSKGKHLYIIYPDGIGRSKLTNGLIEQKLGTRATGRNWNTVLKLSELVGE